MPEISKIWLATKFFKPKNMPETSENNAPRESFCHTTIVKGTAYGILVLDDTWPSKLFEEALSFAEERLKDKSLNPEVRTATERRVQEIEALLEKRKTQENPVRTITNETLETLGKLKNNE